MTENHPYRDPAQVDGDPWPQDRVVLTVPLGPVHRITEVHGDKVRLVSGDGTGLNDYAVAPATLAASKQLGPHLGARARVVIEVLEENPAKEGAKR